MVTEGQLISNAVYGLLTSPKKWTDNFVVFLLFYSSRQTNQICLFIFWENLQLSNLLFNIIWPLVYSYRFCFILAPVKRNGKSHILIVFDEILLNCCSDRWFGHHYLPLLARAVGRSENLGVPGMTGRDSWSSGTMQQSYIWVGSHQKQLS